MRIVVKVGTSTLAHPSGLLNIRHTEDLVKVWSDIQNAGHQLIVVSSAATGLGVGKLQIEKPSDIITKQAAAAVGQCELMYTYDRLFGQYNHTVAQMLLTWEDFDHENRLRNLQNTLERLIQLGAVPVINENDPISTEEYSLGDNDRLGALIAKYLLGMGITGTVIMSILGGSLGNRLGQPSEPAFNPVSGLGYLDTFGNRI